jgi:hypothetical protein
MEIKKNNDLEKQWSAEIMAENDKSNPIGKLLLYAGWAIFAVSIFMTLIHDVRYFTAILGGLVIAGFGEVINILQKIYVNTKK